MFFSFCVSRQEKSQLDFRKFAGNFTLNLVFFPPVGLLILLCLYVFICKILLFYILSKKSFPLLCAHEVELFLFFF